MINAASKFDQRITVINNSVSALVNVSVAVEVEDDTVGFIAVVVDRFDQCQVQACSGDFTNRSDVSAKAREVQIIRCATIKVTRSISNQVEADNGVGVNRPGFSGGSKSRKDWSHGKRQQSEPLFT